MGWISWLVYYSLSSRTIRLATLRATNAPLEYPNRLRVLLAVGVRL